MCMKVSVPAYYEYPEAIFQNIIPSQQYYRIVQHGKDECAGKQCTADCCGNDCIGEGIWGLANS